MALETGDESRAELRADRLWGRLCVRPDGDGDLEPAGAEVVLDPGETREILVSIRRVKRWRRRYRPHGRGKRRRVLNQEHISNLKISD